VPQGQRNLYPKAHWVQFNFGGFFLICRQYFFGFKLFIVDITRMSRRVSVFFLGLILVRT